MRSRLPRDKPTNPLGPLDIESIVRSDSSRLIEASWRALCAHSFLPARPDVSAKALPAGLLASIGICTFSRENTGLKGRYRVAGSRFRQLTGYEVTGAAFDDVIESGSSDQRAALLHHVLERPVGVWWISEVTFGGTYTLPYQSTLLPLSETLDGAANHVLDFVECEIPIAASDMKGVLSPCILRHSWIDIGAGLP